MSPRKLLMFAGVGLALLVAGCHKNAVDKSAFESAINTWYSVHPVCVWSSPVKFPAQADTKDEDQTRGFDALTDAGMLTRTPAEKKRFLIGSKQVNDYDLSAKGRSTWTADPSQPGYGNFCVGHPSVTSIDSYTPADTADASQYSVAYHDAVKNLPDWAGSAEMKTAFPRLVTVTSGQQTATATLVKSNAGWQVTAVSPNAGSGTLPQ